MGSWSLLCGHLEQVIMMPKYSIIIPTYNHCEDLLKPCVQSVLQYTHMAEAEIIISANGCVDETASYVHQLQQDFAHIGMQNHLQVVWHDQPLGYATANNVAILQAKGEHVVLLNNDCVLLPQSTNKWLHQLHTPFVQDPHMGISGVVHTQDSFTQQAFVIFFCVMIHKRVFDHIGLLNPIYQIGGCEDVEFCVKAQKAGFTITGCNTHTQAPNLWGGDFPIYHKGQATLFDTQLVKDWHQTHDRNQQILKLSCL